MKKLLRARLIHLFECSICQGLLSFGLGWGLLIILCLAAIISGIIENLK